LHIERNVWGKTRPPKFGGRGTIRPTLPTDGRFARRYESQGGGFALDRLRETKDVETEEKGTGPPKHRSMAVDPHFVMKSRSLEVEDTDFVTGLDEVIADTHEEPPLNNNTWLKFRLRII